MHTPGPWWVDPTLKLGAIDVRVDDSPETSVIVASVHCTRTLNEADNAQLIAASPDLLVAAKALLRLCSTIEVLGEWEATDTNQKMRVTERAKVDKALDDMQAAIAKATQGG